MKVNRMKIGSAVFAVLMAVAVLAVTGCAPGLGRPPEIENGNGVEGAVFGTVFDMATNEGIQGLTLATGVAPADVFDDSLLTGATGGAPFDVIAGPGGQAVSLRFTTNADWGQGIDMRNADFAFVAGDRVRIAGEIIALPGAASRVQVNRNIGSEHSNVGGVDTERDTVGPFEIEFTLADGDLAQIRGGDPAGLRLEFRGASGITVRVDTIRVQGMRRPDFPGFVPEGEEPVGEEEEVITLGPGDVDALALITGTSGPVTLVTYDRAFRELRIGRNNFDHGLDIILSPATGFAVPVTSLLEEGYVEAGGTYIVRVTGRAADDATGNFEIHTQPWARVEIEPIVPGGAFLAEMEFPITSDPAEDNAPNSRARIRGAGSGELILTNVIVMDATTRIPVWTLAYALAGDAIPTAAVPLRPAPTGVTITPATTTVAQGGTQQFAATVTGPAGVSRAITWSVLPGTEASITQGGLLTVNADSRSPLTVIATATDTAVYASATVVVALAAPPFTPSSITIEPSLFVPIPNQVWSLAVTVEPEGATETVIWTAIGGTITDDGILTVTGAVGTDLVITAVSTLTDAVSDTLTVAIAAPDVVFDLEDWLEDRAEGVLTGDLPAPFQRAGNPTVSVVPTGLQVVHEAGNGWQGVDFLVPGAGGFQVGDILRVTMTGDGEGGGGSTGQVMLQVQSGGPWAGQMIGGTPAITPAGTTVTVNMDDANVAAITDSAFGGRFRIRVNNPVADNTFVITELSVLRSPAPAP